jgi:hypothetical protein
MKSFRKAQIRRRKKITYCENCRKCGETICGNDTENFRCFEPK